MRDQDHQDILRNTEHLRGLLAGCSTETIVRACAADYLKRNNESELPPDLDSPARQTSFLLGIMLTTPEPATPKAFGDEEWKRAVDLLNRIFNAYGNMFFPSVDDTITDAWLKVRQVAMPAFLHYFNSALPARTDQVVERIRLYIVPFDNELLNHFGITSQQTIEICEWMTDGLQCQVARLGDTAKREQTARLTLLDQARNGGWDIDRLKDETRNSPYPDIAREFSEAAQRFSRVSLADLEAPYGSVVAHSFWRLFSVGRGEVKEFKYLTERNIAEERSLYRLSHGEALCPSAHTLFVAAITQFEAYLSSGPLRDRYFRHRDKILEGETERQLCRLVPNRDECLRSVYETADCQFEHDLVIRAGRVCFVVEAKASPPLEPFRDPDKAFTRIRRAFHGDRGIQRAFDQANRIWRRWSSGKPVPLFDDHGNHLTTIDRQTVDEVFMLCVTRDSFGLLAIDLSLLLEIEQGNPYPWAVNILDLEALADAWEYFGWSTDRLTEFLRDRLRLHGRLLSFDELDVAGFFIQHGTLQWLLKWKADRVHLNPVYSNVFDRIYRTKVGGEPVFYRPTNPCLGDLTESLERGYPVVYSPPPITEESETP
jgi:hypothetical protein